jgi:hypothetical protein
LLDAFCASGYARVPWCTGLELEKAMPKDIGSKAPKPKPSLSGADTRRLAELRADAIRTLRQGMEAAPLGVAAATTATQRAPVAEIDVATARAKIAARDPAIAELAARQERRVTAPGEARHPPIQHDAARTSARRISDLRRTAVEGLRAELARLHNIPPMAPAALVEPKSSCDDPMVYEIAATEIADPAISDRPPAATPVPESDQLGTSIEQDALVWGISDLIGFTDEPTNTAVGWTRTSGGSDQRPLVSVILVTYQHEKFIRTAVRSLLAQTYSPLDVIILDDASPDTTATAAAAELAANPGQQVIRFVRNPQNLGFFANTRKGLSMARGDFVIVFCGDDVMLPNMVENMVETWRRYDVSLVTANVAYIDTEGADLHRFHTGELYDDTFETLARDGANSVCFGAAMGFERDLYLEFGYPPDYLTAED